MNAKVFLICKVLASVWFFGMFYLLLWKLPQNAVPTPPNAPISLFGIPIGSVPLRTQFDELYCPDGKRPPDPWLQEEHVQLVFLADGFSANKRILSGRVRLALSNGILATIWDEQNKTWVYDKSNWPVLTLRQEYQNTALDLLITSIGGTASSFKVPITLPTSPNRGSHGVDKELYGPYEFQLEGKPSDYPSDAYHTQLSASVVLTQPLQLKGSNFSSFTNVFGPSTLFLPSDYCAFAGVGLTNIRVTSTGDPGRNEKFTLWFARDYHTLLFTYLIALLPSIMALTLGHYILTHSNPTDNPDPLNILVGTASIMITVLPMRAVLVPQELQDPTFVDLLLGFALTLTACTAIITYGYIVERKQAAAATNALPRSAKRSKVIGSIPWLLPLVFIMLSLIIPDFLKVWGLVPLVGVSTVFAVIYFDSCK